MPKSKYESHVKPNLPLIEMWARNGLSMDEIALNLGISRSTLFKYINEYSDLSDTIKTNRAQADAIVENMAYKLCLGYDYKEQVLTPQGKVEEVQRKRHPDGAMIRKWLASRVPERWSDKQELNVTGHIVTQDEAGETHEKRLDDLRSSLEEVRSALGIKSDRRGDTSSDRTFETTPH